MKYIRFVHLCMGAAAFTLFCGAWQRCLGETPRQAAISAAARSVDAPALHRTRHFFLVSENGSSTPPALGAMLEAIHARLSQAMASHGLSVRSVSDPLLWICFDDQEQYRRHSIEVERANPAFQDAFYSTRTNHVVFYSGGLTALPRAAGSFALSGAAVHLTGMGSGPADERGVCSAVCSEQIQILTHEMAHQLAYNRGLQKRGVMYPLWVSEGLATFFEDCAALPGDPANPSRRQRLAELGRHGRMLPLEKLAVLAGPEALEPSPADAYAQFWGLLGFLLEYHPNELRAYLSDLFQGPQGWRPATALKRDFVRHFGPIEPLDRPWRQYTASLSSPVADEERSVATASGF